MSIRNARKDVHTMKHLVEAVEREALADGGREWGAEHLVLAALALPEGSARRAFDRVGLDPGAYRAAIARQHDDALASIGIDPESQPAPRVDRGPGRRLGLGGTANGRALFVAAGELARKGKHPLCGAHIVLAATGLQLGIAARALDAVCTDRSALSQAAEAEIAEALAVR